MRGEYLLRNGTSRQEMPASDPPDQQATPRCLYRGDRLLRTVEAGGSLPYRRRGLGSWRRTEIRDPSISGEPREERKWWSGYRLTKQGYTFLLPFLLGGRPYPSFLESTRRMRLLLLLLHHTLRPRKKPERDDRQHGGTGAGSRT